MKRIDIHVHLAGFGQGDSGCRISPKMAGSVQFFAMRQLCRFGGIRTDQDYADKLVGYADGSQSLDYACALAMDGVYDAQGDFQPELSHVYVPNSWAIEVARRSPKLLPVISVNPQRKDALEELERWGPQAVALKWLPPAQRFDPSDARYDAFRRLLRSLELPVICHSGTEHTVPHGVQRLGDPSLCEPLLQLGIPVVLAHCGTCTVFQPGADFVPTFGRMLEKYDHAFGDTAGFCSIVRHRNVFRFSTDRYAGRILHGSDFPVPTSSLYYWRELGVGGMRRLQSIANPLDRDAEIKRAAGMPDSVFTKAYELLESHIRRVKG